MIERVIENWLTNSDERGFQIPYCQTLSLLGHRIIYISQHTAFEQGKDIVSVSEDGKICAFQLKSGDISQNRWRKEVRPEVEELLDIPINNPSIDKTIGHQSALV